jgi:hypothetical protein
MPRQGPTVDPIHMLALKDGYHVRIVCRRNRLYFLPAVDCIGNYTQTPGLVTCKRCLKIMGEAKP